MHIFRWRAVALAASLSAGVLLLSACSSDPLTSTSPVAAEHSVCARLFGDPLHAEWTEGSVLPLITVVGDPGYELRCVYGTEGVSEYVVATTRLDASVTHEGIIAGLVDRGYSLGVDGSEATLVSPGRVGDYASEVDLIDDDYWVRVTVVSPEDAPGGIDHAEAVTATLPWLPGIRLALDD